MKPPDDAGPPPTPEPESDGWLPNERRLAYRVGAFVAILLVLGVVVIALLGRTHFLGGRATIHAAFTDVQGLKAGAPVWLSGVYVGEVGHIELPSLRDQQRVEVTLKIDPGALAQLGEDSVARIGAQGLLGDKIVELSIASPGARRVLDGGRVGTVSPPDLNRLAEQAAEAIGDAGRAARIASEAVRRFADPRTVAALQRSIESLNHLLLQAERGPGLVHSAFYDAEQAAALSALATRLESIGRHVDGGLARVEQVLAATDGDGRQLLNNASRAARGVADVTAALDRSQAIPALGRAARDAADLAAWMRAGQGTLGALIVDPTAYEQLVTVLGGIGRSRVLRGLVRFAISRDADKTAGRRVIEGARPRGAPPPAVPARPPPSTTIPGAPTPGERVPAR